MACRRGFPRGGRLGGADLAYRVPLQPSLDGNSVDPHLEKAAYIENAIRFQASLRFLNDRIDGIRNALRRE